MCCFACVCSSLLLFVNRYVLSFLSYLLISKFIFFQPYEGNDFAKVQLMDMHGWNLVFMRSQMQLCCLLAQVVRYIIVFFFFEGGGNHLVHV